MSVENSDPPPPVVAIGEAFSKLHIDPNTTEEQIEAFKEAVLNLPDDIINPFNSRSQSDEITS